MLQYPGTKMKRHSDKSLDFSERPEASGEG